MKTLHTRKRGRISHVIGAFEFDRAILRVVYGNTGFENEGEYTTADEVRAALTAFTEPELVIPIMA